MKPIQIVAALLIVVSVLLMPAVALAWGGAQHVYINYYAGRAVPYEMSAFRDFAYPMSFPGIYPDLWRPQDRAAEGPRHYFEPDRLPEGMGIDDISADRDTFFSVVGATPYEIGVAPWTVMELMEMMSDAMRTNDWIWAARCGAAMGHYVGDLHMPLHCTKNFDGQYSGQSGIHNRYEVLMLKRYFDKRYIRAARSIYLDDPFREIITWAHQANALAPAILAADIAAKAAAQGDVESDAYYEKLWEQTKSATYSQLSDAATHLSSLWYTAWVNAGRPAIPDAPTEPLPTQSIFSGVDINLDFKDDDGLTVPTSILSKVTPASPEAAAEPQAKIPATVEPIELRP